MRIDLSVGDTLDGKFELLKRLAPLAKELLPPTFIISHKRSRDIRTLRNFTALTDTAQVVVRQQELAMYRSDNPTAKLVSIPATWAGERVGAGRAIQYCLAVANMIGHERVLILDDDIKSFTFLHGIGNRKVSQSFDKHLERFGMSRDEYQNATLLAFVLAADEAFTAHPEALLASSQTNNPNRTVASSEVRWELNAGGNPGVARYWDAERFQEAVGSIDLERFHRHGDDVGVALQTIQAKGSIVKVPSFVAHGTDPETESVIRNPETAPGLRAAEHEALMSMPLGDYIRTRYDDLDRPQWHALDWQRLKQDGLAKHDVRRW